MENVTLTLTKGEANFIEYMLTKVASDSRKLAYKTAEYVQNNGSLDGIFGEEIRRLDQDAVDHENRVASFHETLADKITEQIDNHG